ncbi:MAG: MarR family winged helix-turn-helix transcriptional regulator [Planctomycetota bacterium]
MSKIYDDALRPLGLRVSQMNILVAAGVVGEARPADVCAALHLDLSTLSRNVERMKAKGWLEVIPDDDGRAQPFRLTRKGSALLSDAAPAWSKAQCRAKSILGGQSLDFLDRAMKRLNAASS